jgi:hypothetical protein
LGVSHWLEDKVSANPGDTRLDKKIQWVKDHPVIVFALLGGIAIIALGQVTEALDSITSFAERLRGRPESREPIPPESAAVGAETLGVLRSLADEVSGKSESMLRDEFDFDEMVETNAGFLFARYRKAAFGIPFDFERYIKAGTAMRILPGGGGIVNMETGAFTPEKTDRDVRHLILSPAYEKRVSELKRYSDSPFVPQTTKAAVEHYLDVAESNLDLLGELLEAASKELPEKYPTSKTPVSDIWIHNRFVRHFHDLTPAADAIKYDIGKYVAGEAPNPEIGSR